MVSSVKSDTDADLKNIIPDVAELLSHRIGLKPQAMSETAWLRVFKRRKAETHLESTKEYLQHLLTSPKEIQELVELVVVPETWFFRERSALDFLITHVRSAEGKGRLKSWHALSMACASGEEPFSIAMSLIEAGVPTHRCHVEGVDISYKALEIARAALYGPNSFRGRRSLMHKRLFDREDSLLRVQPQVRKYTRFIHDNVVSPTFKLADKHYDIVFCRNLLIYLTPEAQTRVFILCRAMIGRDGLVCFGPAETEMARLAGFVPAGPAGSCFFRAKSRQTTLPTTTKPLQTQKAKRERLVPSDGALLQRAYAEANQGNVSAAMDLCRSYLIQDSSSVDANFLMGTLHQSSRNEDLASEFFKRVVYLDPKHYEALVHLALLAEKSGHSLTAERFWERAKKSHSASEGDQVGDEPFNLPLMFLSEGDNK